MTRTMRDEMRLVRACVPVTESAMAELYDGYSNVVYAVALRPYCKMRRRRKMCCRNIPPALAESGDAFDASRGSLTSWLAVIARHRAIDRLRKRRPETEIEECVIAGGPDLRDETERTLVIEKVRGALQEMNPEQRKALELAFFEGLTHVEIAEKTGEPLGTIKTRIRSGLQQLRARFAG